MHYRSLVRFLNWASAFWGFLLAFIILADITGRILFSTPIQGVSEIVKNSVVAIAFLQLPAAVISGSMLRTEVISDRFGPSVRRFLRLINYTMGAILFFLIVLAGWDDMIFAIKIGEYEGEGALRVPTWPVRIMLAFCATITGISYVAMIIADLRGQLENELRWSGRTHTQANATPESIMTGDKQ